MKHRQIIDALCDLLTEGQGINEALASLNLSTDYLADNLKPKDRVRLHQSRAIYIESLERTCAQRATVGRNTLELRRTIYHLRTEGRLRLPGDDDTVVIERVPKQVEKRPGPHKKLVEKKIVISAANEDEVVDEPDFFLDRRSRVEAFVEEDE